MYIDIHCHLDDERLSDKEQVVKEYTEAGVDTVINVACGDVSSEFGKNFAEKYDSAYFAVGFHPDEIERFTPENFDKVKKLALHPKCVAIGEIGLDYHLPDFDKQKQAECFIRQLEFASEVNLPVEIHSRDATLDTYEILKANRPKAGAVMHCFSGSKETAAEYLKLGFYVSLGGVLTFKNAARLKEVAAFLPLDRILTETDCPGLAPEPFRGTVNAPKNIPYIVRTLASIKGISVEETAEAVKENAKRLFYKLKQ